MSGRVGLELIRADSVRAVSPTTEYEFYERRNAQKNPVNAPTTRFTHPVRWSIGRLQFATFSIHLDRTAGGDRHHRYSGRHAVAGARPGERGWSPHCLCE